MGHIFKALRGEVYSLHRVGDYPECNGEITQEELREEGYSTDEYINIMFAEVIAPTLSSLKASAISEVISEIRGHRDFGSIECTELMFNEWEEVTGDGGEETHLVTVSLLDRHTGEKVETFFFGLTIKK